MNEGEITLSRDPAGAPGYPAASVLILPQPVDVLAAGAYQCWVEDFNPFPPVDFASNDVPMVFDLGVRPGGDMALSRRYAFNFYAEWADAAGGNQLLADLSNVSRPLRYGIADLSFRIFGTTYGLNGRYEPISMVSGTYMLSNRIAEFSVRFRATNPLLIGVGSVL